ncbi:recombinase family protein [Bacillus cereus]|nr:recombinase family protein [Bacillus cereus]
MKCAVYIRASTDKEEQKASLSNQKDLFYNFIEDKEWSLYNTYNDVESSTSDNREGPQQLIEDAQ